MATITIKLTEICPGGAHAKIDLTKNSVVRNIDVNVPDMRAPITQDDIEAFCKVAMKIMNEGKTLNQFRATLLAGFTVTI